MDDNHRLIRYMFVACAQWETKRVYDVLNSHPDLHLDIVRQNTLLTAKFMITSSFENLVTIGLELGVLKMANLGEAEKVPSPPKSRRWLRRSILARIA